MTHQVTLPDNVWGRLASLADKNGSTVADELTQAITVHLKQPGIRTPKPVEQPVYVNERLAAVVAEVRAAARAKRRSPLTTLDVAEIRRARAEGETLKAIGDRFGIAGPTVSKIASGQRHAPR